MNFHCRLFHTSKKCYYLRKFINVKYLESSIHNVFPYQHHSISTSSLNSNVKAAQSTFQSVISKIPFLNLSKTKLKVSGYLLYESVADNVIYSDFFTEFSLPDTFNSWFVITELHVWMLLTRSMADGKDGRVTRNSIVQALWSDVNIRTKKLGAASLSRLHMQVDELSQQFQAALVGYDEGLLSNDKVLAGALWRRFFQQECDNPEHLEKLVHYVRKQIKMLDSLSSEEFFEKRKLVWSPINTIK